MMTALNGNALNDARVSIVNTDAFHWLQQLWRLSM
jgi:spermidine synthase